MRYHYIPVPDEIAQNLLEAGTKRVVISAGGKTYRRALQSTRSEPCIVVGMPILREIGVSLGEVVELVIYSDPESEHVELGEEFEEVLKQDKLARQRFNAMTTGQRRSLAYYVTSAKRVDTRIKRALEIARKLRTHSLHSDR